MQMTDVERVDRLNFSGVFFPLLHPLKAPVHSNVKLMQT